MTPHDMIFMATAPTETGHHLAPRCLAALSSSIPYQLSGASRQTTAAWVMSHATATRRVPLFIDDILWTTHRA